MRDKLTDTKIRARKEPGLLGDGAGIYLKIGPTGTKSWVFKYAPPNGATVVRSDGKERRKLRSIGLGGYPDVSLAMVREKALLLRRQLLDGLDPLAERRRAAVEQAVADAKLLTFRQCAEQFVTGKEAGWTAKHAQDWTSSVRDHVYPIIGDLPVAAIDTALVHRVLQPIWNTKTETASRIRGRIESVLAWATARSYRTGDNPARWRGHLDTHLAAPAAVATIDHLAALPYEQMAAFMVELRAVDTLPARALEFLVLTAARSGEVAGATWVEIDADVWTVPPERMKAGREHVVPLSQAALAILAELPRTGDLIFGKLVNNSMHRVLRSLRKTVTVHGFRSAFSTWAGEETEFAREVIEECLAHETGNAVERAYRRGNALAKRRVVMAAWAAYCGGETPGGVVVPLRA
jgi:integrase